MERKKIFRTLLLISFIWIVFNGSIAFAASPIISEQYIIVFDFSGTFVKDRNNISQSLGKVNRFAQEIDKKTEEFKAEAIKEARGRKLRAPDINTYFTIIGMGSRPQSIWSGNAQDFLKLCKDGEIQNLINKAVEQARRTGDTKCTDIRGALDLSFRRLKPKRPDREFIIRAGVVMFSDLLDDPPDSTGKCSNVGNPTPPAGDVWDAITDYLEDNKDRANTPPVFYPKFSLIALGVIEQTNKAADAATLWTEKLTSLQPSSEPFELEFRSFANAVNYSIPAPSRFTITEIQSYLDNFDPIEGKRIQQRPGADSKGGSNILKIALVVVIGGAVLIFFVVILIISGIVLFVYLRRRRQNRPTS